VVMTSLDVGGSYRVSGRIGSWFARWPAATHAVRRELAHG